MAAESLSANRQSDRNGSPNAQSEFIQLKGGPVTYAKRSLATQCTMDKQTSANSTVYGVQSQTLRHAAMCREDGGRPTLITDIRYHSPSGVLYALTPSVLRLSLLLLRKAHFSCLAIDSGNDARLASAGTSCATHLY